MVAYRTVMTLVVATMAFFILIMGAGAVPYIGNEFTYYQPNGEAIQIRLYGDEFYAVAETLDGYSIVKDPVTQDFCYADLSADGTELESTGIRVGNLAQQSRTKSKKDQIEKLNRKEVRE